MGYSDAHKGYKCINSSGKLYISTHVVFKELDFPFESLFKTQPQPEAPEIIIPYTLLPFDPNNYVITPNFIDTVQPQEALGQHHLSSGSRNNQPENDLCDNSSEETNSFGVERFKQERIGSAIEELQDT